MRVPDRCVADLRDQGYVVFEGFLDGGELEAAQDGIDHSGKLTLRHNGRLHRIGIGRAYTGWRVVMLVAGLEIRILTLDGTQLRRPTPNPDTDYQPS
jgi:hypothetical protein